MRIGAFEDLFVFDDRIVLQMNNKMLKVVYLNDLSGKGIAKGFDDKQLFVTRYSNETIQKVTFWDETGQGDFKLFVLMKIKASAAEEYLQLLGCKVNLN